MNRKKIKKTHTHFFPSTISFSYANHTRRSRRRAKYNIYCLRDSSRKRTLSMFLISFKLLLFFELCSFRFSTFLTKMASIFVFSLSFFHSAQFFVSPFLRRSSPSIMFSVEFLHSFSYMLRPHSQQPINRRLRARSRLTLARKFHANFSCGYRHLCARH